MLTIWKYQLLGISQDVEMPEGAKILGLQEQNGKLTMWALVNPDAYRSRHARYHVVGTGNFLQDDFACYEYIGTCQVRAYVWHVFREEL
jgi:hypothetical protein